MFLHKIEKLATDWSKQQPEMESVARESLLYGMRLVRHPSALKKELKKANISSLLAKPLWSGNAYLLHVLPEVLCDRKKKIPCLPDLLFARKVLSEAHLKELRECRKKRCKIPTDELFETMLPKIKQQTWRGRFIPQFDAMNENLKDIEHDLIVEALVVMNKEMSNFRTDNKEEIANYLSFCLKSKSDTYLKRHKPKAIKARIEAEDFERIVHQERMQDSIADVDFSQVELQQDLKKVLDRTSYRAISLLMQFADDDDRRGFARYLKGRNIKDEWTTQAQLKTHIEKYLGKTVFSDITHNPFLKKFLMDRIQPNETGVYQDAVDSEYARCAGL